MCVADLHTYTHTCTYTYLKMYVYICTHTEVHVNVSNSRNGSRCMLGLLICADDQAVLRFFLQGTNGTTKIARGLEANRRTNGSRGPLGRQTTVSEVYFQAGSLEGWEATATTTTTTIADIVLTKQSLLMFYMYALYVLQSREEYQ